MTTQQQTERDEMAKVHRVGDRCPTCNSPSPERHPAMAWEGEVEICTDDFHLIASPQNRPGYIAQVLEKRAANNGLGMGAMLVPHLTRAPA